MAYITYRKMDINPDTAQDHAILQEESKAWFRDKGFVVVDNSYNLRMSKDQELVIRNKHNPSTFDLRGQADTFVANLSKDKAAYVEFKTVYGNHRNLGVEAWPLAKHLNDNRVFGAECLYVWRNKTLNRDGAFWTSDAGMPNISRIIIPTERWSQEWINRFTSTFENSFPGVRLEYRDYAGGSNYPFAIINEFELVMLPHWKDAVEHWINPVK